MKPISQLRHRGNLDVVELAQLLAVEQHLPLLGWSSVPMMFNNVLLPDPDGPTIATGSPRPISSETSRNTGNRLGASRRFVALGHVDQFQQGRRHDVG